MRITRTGVAALTISAVALSIAAVGPAEAAKKLITGADIKNNSVTGADIKESTLAAVPKADKLTVLKSGKSLTGAFGGGGGSSTGGWFGEGITFQQPLPGVPADYKVVDTYVNPDATNCPGPGHAAKGYLCLYFTYHYNTGTVYKAYVNAIGYAATPVYGLSIYYPVTGASSYASGSWTATAK
ncbi:MAG: hypothetical protein QM655_16320 [Nocardioidaceae bacterium]